jgi:hypothetical protein
METQNEKTDIKDMLQKKWTKHKKNNYGGIQKKTFCQKLNCPGGNIK